ncbi:MAG: acylphosphatase [bacterium]|nr:acylphosphatase [bacterium]
MKTYHYIVKGHVQGVAFRYYTQSTAQKLLIKGSVKNLYNGDVEVYAQGDTGNIKKFEEFLNSGPISARVQNVIKEELNTENPYISFEITY